MSSQEKDGNNFRVRLSGNESSGSQRDPRVDVQILTGQPDHRRDQPRQPGAGRRRR